MKSDALSVAEAIRTRRTIRHYRPDPVPASQLASLLSLAIEAPTSHEPQTPRQAHDPGLSPRGRSRTPRPRLVRAPVAVPAPARVWSATDARCRPVRPGSGDRPETGAGDALDERSPVAASWASPLHSSWAVPVGALNDGVAPLGGRQEHSLMTLMSWKGAITGVRGVLRDEMMLRLVQQARVGGVRRPEPWGRRARLVRTW
ncbi:nitroreductase family protein [Nonomuraea sp. 3N208]|uniref:nitroreductase family protein n=1 Tax=Nonomuraea sp. 3N208 TaxID=3457421 RepID=UPI003FCD1704